MWTCYSYVCVLNCLFYICNCNPMFHVWLKLVNVSFLTVLVHSLDLVPNVGKKNIKQQCIMLHNTWIKVYRRLIFVLSWLLLFVVCCCLIILNMYKQMICIFCVKPLFSIAFTFRAVFPFILTKILWINEKEETNICTFFFLHLFKESLQLNNTKCTSVSIYNTVKYDKPNHLNLASSKREENLW